MELKDLKGVKSVSSLIPKNATNIRGGFIRELYDAMIDNVDKSTTKQVMVTMQDDVKMTAYSGTFRSYLKAEGLQDKYEFFVSPKKHIVTCRMKYPGEKK